jgi:hypothetical protein
VVVANGGVVTIRAELSPAAAGLAVDLYRRLDKTGQWTLVGTAHTDASGAATWTQVVKVPAQATGYGRYLYFRATLKPAGAAKAVWSNVVRAVAR